MVLNEPYEFADAALQAAADPANNWAAIVLVLVVFAVAVITGYRLNMEYKRSNERAMEGKARFDAEQARRRLESEQTMQVLTAMNDRYDETLKGVSTTLGAVTEVLRDNEQTLQGTRAALERNSELLERILQKGGVP